MQSYFFLTTQQMGFFLSETRQQDGEKKKEWREIQNQPKFLKPNNFKFLKIISF